MEAVVTVKMTPTELDMVTVSLAFYKDAEYSRSKDKDVPAAERHDAGTNVLKCSNMLDKLAR